MIHCEICTKQIDRGNICKQCAEKIATERRLEQSVRERLESLSERETQLVTRLCNGENYESIVRQESQKKVLANAFKKFGIKTGSKSVQMVSLLMLPAGHPWKQSIMQRNGWADANSSS